jgi:hypothetical protein
LEPKFKSFIDLNPGLVKQNDQMIPEIYIYYDEVDAQLYKEYFTAHADNGFLHRRESKTPMRANA